MEGRGDPSLSWDRRGEERRGEERWNKIGTREGEGRRKGKGKPGYYHRGNLNYFTRVPLCCGLAGEGGRETCGGERVHDLPYLLPTPPAAVLLLLQGGFRVFPQI